MLWNTPASCDFSRTATWLSVRLSPCESTVPEIVPAGSAASPLCALALGIKLVRKRFRSRIGRKFARSNRFSGFRVSYSISTCRTLLRFPLGGLCGLGEISRSDAGSHILQSFMDCVCGFASAAVHPFLLPTVAHDANLLPRKFTVCLVLYISLQYSCQKHSSFSPGGKRLQTNEKTFRRNRRPFEFCLKRRHSAPS